MKSSIDTSAQATCNDSSCQYEQRDAGNQPRQQPPHQAFDSQVQH